MNRHRRVVGLVLACAIAASLAGCVLDWQDDSELAIHLKAVDRADLGQEFVLPTGELSARQRALLEAGLTGGTTDYGRSAFEENDVVRIDGTYYAVTVTENRSESVERPVLTATETATAEGDLLNRSTLTESDERTLRCAIATRNLHCVIYGGNESAFLPELPARYLERGDLGFYELAVTERSVQLTRREYAFEPVAKNRSAFADYAASELVAIDFDEEELPAGQREILSTAAETGSTVSPRRPTPRRSRRSRRWPIVSGRSPAGATSSSTSTGPTIGRP